VHAQNTILNTATAAAATAAVAITDLYSLLCLLSPTVSTASGVHSIARFIAPPN